MRAEPCAVCNGTELKLIDGFYYCVECDTQNTNVRETVVEHKALGDGTFAISNKRKIVKLHDSKIQMSAEWYKWHAYNFIILGLADEMVAVGAKPTFKLKLLWIWTRYIKKYQNKEELGLAKKTQNGENENVTLTSFMVEETSRNSIPDDGDDEEIVEAPKKKSNKNVILDGSRRDIKFISRGLILAMLYLALNLDESEIQLSHIYRFLKEKHLNFSNLQRFVPEDIHMKGNTEWTKFLHSKICNMHQVRALALSLLRILNLGTPKVPDLRKIVDNFMTELCLPNDMKPLIYSLMHFHCCDRLDINNKNKEFLCRLPDYEGVVMSYILVAVKMCFGLDSDYENRLSCAIDYINEERDLSKSHRIGKYSEPSNRMFSFREWCSYMQFRKILLCKSSLNMAEQHCLDIDDYVYMEHMPERSQKKKELQDETAMDLLNKIPEDNEGRVIPKELFVPSLTPMSDYTDIIIDYTQDSDIRLLLSEDFTQYSLKYACEYLNLVDTNTENLIKGISEHGKIFKDVILGTIVTKKSKSEMVYVKNCENRNWMITKPPTMEHVICEDKKTEHKSSDKESDHGYDSENPSYEKEINSIIEQTIDDSNQNITEDGNEVIVKDSGNPANEKEINSIIEQTIDDLDQNQKDEKLVIIKEEDADRNIFDDSFEKLDLKDEIEENNIDEPGLNDEVPQLHNNNSLNDDRDSISDASDFGNGIAPFNPDTFDRERTIKELILNACKKHKIPVPSEYRTPRPRKRKAEMFNNEAGTSGTNKRTKTKPGESKKKVEELIRNYYSHMHSDLLTKMQQEVSLAIQNSQFSNLLNGTQNDSLNPTDIDQPNGVLSDAVEKSSNCNENLENQSTINPQNSDLQQTGNNEQNLEKEDDIDENLESDLFKDDEIISIGDLIPKTDPRFDEKKYDINQLFLEVKVEKEEIYDIPIDSELKPLLIKKIEECKNNTEFEKLNPIAKPVKTIFESDSEDEIPLNVLRDEKKQIQEMMEWEEKFDPLINKENIPEFKYWFRHYDPDFMTRSVDWHIKFDEELKENTPASFYFVIRECANIINSTTFHLYKHMQNLEQYIIAKAKNPD